MATLIPTSQHQQSTTPSAPVSAIGGETYEDMFKEITRKLYGDESAHGLYPINNSQVAQLAQTPSAPPEGERSFTTLVSDRSLAQLEYDGVIAADVASSSFKSEEHLSTAFGLAALMHNGFPPPTINFPVSGTSSSKQQQQQQNNQSAGNDDRQWNQQQSQHQQNQPHQTEDGIAWQTNKISNTYSQKLFKIKAKQEPAPEIVINTVSNNQTNGTANIKIEGQQIQKRYNCQNCSYSTDRRDLYTRHENIHKAEKPFHCYACMKQFNRADHVKKHFLRMHRELEYSIEKTRRYAPSKGANAPSVNNNNSTNQKNNYLQPYNPPAADQNVGTTINIPNYSTQHHTIEHVVQNGVQQQQQQQQQQNVSSHQVTTIKHEKTSQDKSIKKKGEKRFMCCYCPWSGADNWGLKRHLNTHTKPFVCLLCDYKAARSERLTTHIFKVHNKKACNKCNFFADDAQQLNVHQIEAHQNEVRAPRTTNNTTTNNHSTSQTIVTNNTLANQSMTNVSVSQNTGNVLRTLTNTFVPNTLHTTSTNHVFGTLNTTLNNVASTIYTTSNANTNLVEQLNHHLTSSNNWRTTNNNNNTNNNSLSNINITNNNTNVSRTQQPSATTLTLTTTTGTTLKRKSGAERLFAYFEADDSDDIELDYARQLQMQAMSRNTASVAQDFRSAGGEAITSNTTQTACHKQQSNRIITQNVTNQNRDATDMYGAIGQLQKKKIKAMSPIDHSPPATQTASNIINASKRRRNSSPSNDKENDLLTKQLTFIKEQHKIFLQYLNANAMSNSERLKAVQEINEIFETMYHNSLTLISSIEVEKRKIKEEYEEQVIKIEPLSEDEKMDTSDETYALPAFLKNNKEITIIMQPKSRNENNSKNDIDLNHKECRKNRKQLKPKKIEKPTDNEDLIHRNASMELKDPKAIISNLRDKHMVCLVTRKKCCFLCRNKSSDANSFYTKTSLLLHTRWRHQMNKYECDHCQIKFNQIYKLRLHKRIHKH